MSAADGYTNGPFVNEIWTGASRMAYGLLVFLEIAYASSLGFLETLGRASLTAIMVFALLMGTTAAGVAFWRGLSFGAVREVYWGSKGVRMVSVKWGRRIEFTVSWQDIDVLKDDTGSLRMVPKGVGGFNRWAEGVRLDSSLLKDVSRFVSSDSQGSHS